MATHTIKLSDGRSWEQFYMPEAGHSPWSLIRPGIANNLGCAEDELDLMEIDHESVIMHNDQPIGVLE
jgi:hypothetical protein